MVDFQKKINFLLKDLYGDVNKLTEAFISISPSKEKSKQLRSRKVTIRKWIDEEIKITAPYRFHTDYDKYAISQLRFKDGREVFPFIAFDDWTFKKFKSRLEEYRKDKKSKHIFLEDYKYIYYYHEDSENLSYFEIIYQENDMIKLSTHHHAQVISYTGEIIRDIHSSMLHFVVSNELEMMFFSFSELDLKLDFDVYGLCLSKDFLLKNPKSSLTLLSQNILNLHRENLFKTKINGSNITIVNNEKKGEEESFIDNLSIHLRNLKTCTDAYLSKNIFLNLFLEEFNLFYKKFDQFYNQFEYYFSFFSKSMTTMLKLLEQTKERHHLKIIYTLKDLNKSLFNHADNDSITLYNSFVRLSEDNKMSFEFIITIGDKVVINKKLKDKFKEFESAGISLLFNHYRDIQAYATIVLVKDYQKLAISGLKGEKQYKITRCPTEVNKLKKEYEIQKNHAEPLQNMLNKDYPLNGTWYLYGHGSNDTLHFATIDIDGDEINIILNSHDDKKYHGEIFRVHGEVLLCTDLAFIKFKEDEKNQIIKIVSLMSDQHNGNGKPVILFAFLSRVKLEKEDRDILFSALVDRQSSPYDKASFKLSLSIDEVLCPLLFKYDDIYNRQ